MIESPLDAAVLGVAGLVLAVMTGTWAWGQAAGLLTHGAWPRVGAGEGLRIAGRLPRHLSDPAGAWPVQARAGLPGPVAFYTVGLALAAATTAVLALLGRAWWTRRTVRGFASRRQLAATLGVPAVLARGRVVRPSLAGTRPALEQVGVALGRSVPGRIPLAASVEDSVAVLAAPRQGKTSQVVIPWLHRWPGPALVTSIRPDVLLATATLRAETGPVLVMAPTGMVDWPHLLTWSPTAGCGEFDRARQRADVMVTVGKSDQHTDSNDGGFFGQTATNLLAGWLHAAAITGRGMTDVLRWGLDERLDEPVRLLRDHPAAAPGTAAMLDNIYRSPADTTRNNLWTTVQTAIAPLLSPTAQATFCPPPGRSADLAALLRGRGTVYLMVSEKRATGLAPLIAAFVDDLIDTAKTLADTAPGGRLDPPLGLFLDEVANVAPLPDLPALMSFAGGTGIFVTAVLQSMAQAQARWGRDRAAMLFGAATVKVILGGLSGQELRDLSELVGDYQQHRVSHQRGSAGSSTQTVLHDTRTITPDQIRTLDTRRREALVIHATTPAVTVRMVRHYEGPHRAAHATAETQARQLLRSSQSTVDGERNVDGERDR